MVMKERRIIRLIAVLFATMIILMAFSSCSEIKKKFGKNNQGNETTYSEGLKYELAPDGASYILVGTGKCNDSKIVIPPTYNGLPVVGIGDDAFRGYTSLTMITIPDSVTSIGASAFVGCESLPYISIPKGVTNIGTSAFKGCTSLTSITIPDSVKSIGERAFED